MPRQPPLGNSMRLFSAMPWSPFGSSRDRSRPRSRVSSPRAAALVIALTGAATTMGEPSRAAAAGESAACEAVGAAAWETARRLTFSGIAPNAHRSKMGALEVTSAGAASILTLPHGAEPRAEATLSWRWSAEGALGPADLTRIGRDDRIAALLVGFEPKREAMSALERMRHRFHRGLADGPTPWRVIAYTWASEADAPTVFPSPHLPAQHMVKVIRRGFQGGERGEIVRPFEDYAALFGGPAPAISSISVVVDTDDTGAGSQVRLRLSELCLPR